MRYEKRFNMNWPQLLYDLLEEYSAEERLSKSELLAALFADQTEGGEIRRTLQLLEDYREKFERLIIDEIEDERQSELLRTMFTTFHKVVANDAETSVGKTRGKALRRILERLDNDDPSVGGWLVKSQKEQGGEGVGGDGSNDAGELAGVSNRN